MCPLGPFCFMALFPSFCVPVRVDLFVCVQVLQSFQKSSGQKNSPAHEAAYDAYMTGCSFVALMKDLQPHDAELVNRANLMFSLYEVWLCICAPMPRTRFFVC